MRRQGHALLPAHRKPPAPEPTLTRLDVTTCFDGGDGKLIKVRLRPRCASASDAVRLRLKVLRPLDPPNVYGLQPFKVAPASAAALPPMQLDKACSVRAMGVHATLAVEPAARSGPPRVKLLLSFTRPRPKLLTLGWAQRPPTVRTMRTSEQKALLVELFERADRPSDSDKYNIFHARFCNATGPYAREHRLTRVQIKSFMSQEKARRQKAAAAGLVGAALQDGTLEAEDGNEGAAAEPLVTPRSVGPATEGGTKAGLSQGSSAPVAEMQSSEFRVYISQNRQADQESPHGAAPSEQRGGDAQGGGGSGLGQGGKRG